MDYYGNAGQNETMQNRPKGEKNGFGIASMVLGIVSVLLFCTCVNWITGTLAIIFGIIQIVKNKERGFAVAGIITSGISFILSSILYIALFIGISRAGLDYRDFYRNYYDDYDYYDYYDNYDDYYEWTDQSLDASCSLYSLGDICILS